MKKFPFRFKIIAIMLILAFTLQTMESINNHTYTTGFSNFHSSNGIICCFGCTISNHMTYKCGTPFHF